MEPTGPAGAAKPASERWHVRLRESTFFQRATAFYHRHQRIAPVVFFFGGVVWDMTTLNRIDAWVDNAILLGYLVAAGVLICLAALLDCGAVESSKLKRYEAWFPAAIQFFLGALFSAYVIFYSQSASLTGTSAFLVLLVVLLVANEFIHARLFNLYLLFALYYLAAASFFIFFIPVVTSQMSYATFLAGGLLSLGVVGWMLRYLWRKRVLVRLRQFWGAFGIALVLFGLLNVFYQKNWIPPVPMAMRYAGIFHDARKQITAGGAAVFRLRYEKPAWYALWDRSDGIFHWTPGEPVYCFTAIFAPTDLEKRIYHEWQYWEDDKQAWASTDRIGYDVTGGREAGYRGYTVKRHVRPGRWRINVQTADGRLLGRIRFEIVEDAVSERELAERVYR